VYHVLTWSWSHVGPPFGDGTPNAGTKSSSNWAGFEFAFTSPVWAVAGAAFFIDFSIFIPFYSFCSRYFDPPVSSLFIMKKREKQKHEQAEVGSCRFPWATCCTQECYLQFSQKFVARLRSTILKYKDKRAFLQHRQKVETTVRRRMKPDEPVDEPVDDESEATFDLDISSSTEEEKDGPGAGWHVRTRYFVDSLRSVQE